LLSVPPRRVGAQQPAASDTSGRHFQHHTEEHHEGDDGSIGYIVKEARDETRQEENYHEWIARKGEHVPHAIAPSVRHRFVGSAGEQAFLRLGLRQTAL
jgi:hypothetical protein